MTTRRRRTAPPFPPHGQIGYLQIPAAHVEQSAAFYHAVFDWQTETTHASFEAPGMIGQFVIDRAPALEAGPVIWICVEEIGRTFFAVMMNGGVIHGAPRLDQEQRWLAEISDPAGNRIGLVAPRRTARPQTMITVRDVEASSRWYQTLLGLTGDHGGPEYERLSADGVLVLQLHHWDTEHHHGNLGDVNAPVGNGALVWFGEVTDFDGVVKRAKKLKAPVVLPPHRNPPSGEGNGPAHREIWLRDPDGYTVVVASPDCEAFELEP